MSDSVRPHRWQPTRLPRPWDFPGKNTGVRRHFLLQFTEVKSESEVAQSCPTLRNPMDCSPPGSSVHGIFQARVLEWADIAFSVMVKRIYQIPLGHNFNSIHLPFFAHKNISIIKSEVLKTGSVRSCAAYVLNSIPQDVMEICC